MTPIPPVFIVHCTVYNPIKTAKNDMKNPILWGWEHPLLGVGNICNSFFVALWVLTLDKEDYGSKCCPMWSLPLLPSVIIALLKKRETKPHWHDRLSFVDPVMKLEVLNLMPLFCIVLMITHFELHSFALVPRWTLMYCTAHTKKRCWTEKLFCWIVG